MTDWTQGPDKPFPSNSYITWLPDQAVKLRADDEQIASDPPVSIVTTFKEVAEKNPDRIAMVDSHDDVEDVYTYKRYYESVIHMAKTFIKLGLESSHGVGIMGFNSPQWFISYLGAIFAGGVAAGLSHTAFGKSNPHLADIARCNIIVLGVAAGLPHTAFGKSNPHLADIARCNIIVFENDDLLQSFFERANDLPHLKAVIQYRGKPNQSGPRKVYSWDEIMKMNVDDCEEEFEKRIMNMAPNKLCALITTSGTTGQPKWVMLSHDNIIWTLKSFMKFVNEGATYPPDTIVSYLNLCLMSAHVVDIYWPLLCNGGTVYFAKRDSLKGSIVETLRKTRPTVLIGFPLLYEKLMSYLVDSEVINNTNEKVIFSCAEKANQLCNSKLWNNVTTRIKQANHFDLKEIRSRLGLDKCRLATIAGKACQHEIIEFFQALGIPLIQLYAMSETGCIASNLQSSFKVDSVGHVIPGVRLKLVPVLGAENAEVCLFGRNIFMGYLNNEQSSKEAFDENMWFRTSDLGNLDESGMLTLVGRLNDFIVQSDNRKLLPLPIEKRVLEQLPCLSHCVIVGEDEDFLNILLVFKTKVDPESDEPTDFLDQAALDWCRNLGINAEKLSDLTDARIAEEIQKVIDKTNEQAPSNKEAICKWKILPRQFSAAGGELGPSMKLKRKAINQLYRREILEFYVEQPLS